MIAEADRRPADRSRACLDLLAERTAVEGKTDAVLVAEAQVWATLAVAEAVTWGLNR